MYEKKIECIMDNKKPTRIVVLGNAGVGKTGKRKLSSFCFLFVLCDVFSFLRCNLA